MKNVTMRDIGAALGVSTVTISKALGGKEGVSDAVREKIIETAKQMGYHYSAPLGDDSGRVVGILVAAVSGYLALRFMLKMITRVPLSAFAIYLVNTQPALWKLTDKLFASCGTGPLVSILLVTAANVVVFMAAGILADIIRRALFSGVRRLFRQFFS